MRTWYIHELPEYDWPSAEQQSLFGAQHQGAASQVQLNSRNSHSTWIPSLKGHSKGSSVPVKQGKDLSPLGYPANWRSAVEVVNTGCRKKTKTVKVEGMLGVIKARLQWTKAVITETMWKESKEEKPRALSKLEREAQQNKCIHSQPLNMPQGVVWSPPSLRRGGRKKT